MKKAQLMRELGLRWHIANSELPKHGQTKRISHTVVSLFRFRASEKRQRWKALPSDSSHRNLVLHLEAR